MHKYLAVSATTIFSIALILSW